LILRDAEALKPLKALSRFRRGYAEQY
jgi:hypothetical protein